MSEIKERLKETSDVCLSAYEKWSAADKSADTREALQEAIHELRKVASRLEIELAISEREQMAQKPIPIPPHRDAKKRGGGHDGNDADDNFGNTDNPPQQQRKPQRRRQSHKKSGE